MQLQPYEIKAFQEKVWNHYHQAARTMPWRENPSPYWVLVSELMLQQTQVSRVIPKFAAFTQKFPDIASLAEAPLSEVLQQWSGLGYNRRAKFLHLAANQVTREFGGRIPDTAKELMLLSGVGVHTAGAILAYAFQQPVVFIETNIRTVYFYHFFADRDQIDDKELAEVVAQTLDAEQPREWYWALMDYGTFLKQTAGNNIARSRHYRKQSAFVGSVRQLRGAALRQLTTGPQSVEMLAAQLDHDPRIESVIATLQQEGFVDKTDNILKLTDHR